MTVLSAYQRCSSRHPVLLIAAVIISLSSFRFLLSSSLELQSNGLRASFSLVSFGGNYKSHRPPCSTDAANNRVQQSLIDGLATVSKKRRLRRLVLRAVDNASSTPRSIETLRSGSIRDIDAISGSISDAIVVAPVPLPTTDAQDPAMVFGIATTVERLMSGLTLDSPPAYKALAHFATPNTVFRMTLPVTDEAAVPYLESKLRAAGLQVDITLSHAMTWDERWLETVQRSCAIASGVTSDTSLHERVGPWFAMIDDDTFFPSISDVWTMLKRYPEPEEVPWYIGAEAEPKYIVDNWPSHANGGAGIFLSSAMLRELNIVFREHKCADRDAQIAADEYLGTCIAQALGYRVQQERSLHQIHDVNMGVDGLYESPGEIPSEQIRVQRADGSGQASGHVGQSRLLSVHHWRRDNAKRDMIRMASVARKSGARSLFHRYLIWDAPAAEKVHGDSNSDSNFEHDPSAPDRLDENLPRSDGFWVMTNGYSLVHHTSGEPQASGVQSGRRAYARSGGEQDAVEHVLSTTELASPTSWHYVWDRVRPLDDPSTTLRYDFRTAMEGQGDEPWFGYFVHETEHLVDIVEVIWV